MIAWLPSASHQTSPGFVRQLSPRSCKAPRELKLSDSLTAAQAVEGEAPPGTPTTWCIKNCKLHKRELVLRIQPLYKTLF